jgi:hypothetical protein
MLTGVVAKHRTTPGFVEGHPMFDFVSKMLKDDADIIRVISHEFVLVERTAVSVHKLVWKVPVKQGNKRLDAGSEKVIDEL